jgi:hypothetical protein
MLVTALGTQTFAFECGKSYGPCGQSVPEDVLCEMGPGWCAPGYYWAQEGCESKCMTEPKDCGKAGES